MKVKKSHGFIIVHCSLLMMFFYIAIFLPDYLISIGISLVTGIVANIVQYTYLQVQDAKYKSIHYRPELDSNNHVQTQETLSSQIDIMSPDGSI